MQYTEKMHLRKMSRPRNVPQKASDIISLLLRWYVHLEPKEASSTVRNSAS